MKIEPRFKVVINDKTNLFIGPKSSRVTVKNGDATISIKLKKKKPDDKK